MRATKLQSLRYYLSEEGSKLIHWENQKKKAEKRIKEIKAEMESLTKQINREEGNK